MMSLEKKIQKAQEAYYAGIPIMSDIEFDALWDQLPENSELRNSIGSDLGESNGFFNKCKHDIVMGSQNKANTKEDMAKFLKSNESYISQLKMDGSSVALTYKDGKLIRAASRGDGTIGVDYTDNVCLMGGVVQELSKPYSFTVRGEVLLSKSNKDEYFPDAPNCRNMATGIFHRITGDDCDKLDVVVYDLQGSTLDMQDDVQKFLEKEGFKVAPWKYHERLTAEDAMTLLSETFETDFRDEYDYDIDGIVFKQNVIDEKDLKEYRPKTQIALKPARTIVTTTLVDIEWKQHNGTFTPVGVVKPVDILGATITQASLCNLRMIEDLGLEIGHEVQICRCGEIIPKIIKDVDTGKFVEGYGA